MPAHARPCIRPDRKMRLIALSQAPGSRCVCAYTSDRGCRRWGVLTTILLISSSEKSQSSPLVFSRSISWWAIRSRGVIDASAIPMTTLTWLDAPNLNAFAVDRYVPVSGHAYRAG